MIRWAVWLMASSGAAMACDADGVPMVAQENEAPAVYLAVGEVPLAQPFSMRVTVCDDRAITALRVDAIMPAHQHGMNYTPRVTALGRGVFAVDEMLFHMPGRWQVQVDVALGGQATSYTFDIAAR